MYNASYHSQRSDSVPVKSWTKKRMQDMGKSFPPKAKKVEIFNMIARLNGTPRYFLDDMAADAG